MSRVMSYDAYKSKNEHLLGNSFKLLEEYIQMSLKLLYEPFKLPVF